MKLPWHSKTGLAKAATILAMVLIISFGLCGANFFAVIRFVPFGGSEADIAQHQVVTNVLTFTAYAELVGIFGSLLGLAICAVMAVFQSTGSGEPPPTITKGDH